MFRKNSVYAIIFLFKSVRIAVPTQNKKPFTPVNYHYKLVNLYIFFQKYQVQMQGKYKIYRLIRLQILPHEKAVVTKI